MSYNPLLPPGQAVMASSAPVVLSSDHSDVKVTLDGETITIVSLPALVAGTANIGDVDVLTVPADPFGVNADAASATGSISAKLRFIASTGIPITGTVTVGAHAVTNAGTFAVQVDGAALTALQLIDDPVVILGTATYTETSSKGNVMAAVRRDADTTLVDTTNEFGPLQMDANGRLKIEAFSGETLPVSMAQDVMLGTDFSGVFGSSDLSTSLGADDTNNGTDSVYVSSFAYYYNGASWDRIRGDSVAGLLVDLGANNDVTVTGAALTSLQLADDVVYTDDTSTHATGTSKGTGMMAVANPTDAAVDANDIGMLAMTLARALKNDITTIAGTAPTTAGFIDIKGADGNVFVRQATASNLNMTEASAASILTSVQLIDDMIYTDDTSTHATGTSKGALMMAAATPTDAAVNANDIGALAMTVNRELLVQVNTALPAGTNGIGKLTSNAGVTIGAVEIAAAQTLATVTTVSTVTSVTNVVAIGTSVTPGTSAGHLGKAEDAIHNTGDTGVMMLLVGNEAQNTFAADGDYIPSASDIKGNSMIVGNIAHDGVDAGNPIKIGFKAVTTAFPTAVASADRANGISDSFGRQLVGHIDAGQVIWKSYNDTASRAAGSAQILWTPTSGKKIAITSVVIAAYGTTAARMFLFFAANADLTYSAGSDQPVFVGSFAPSTTAKPIVVITPAVPIIANTADYKLLYQNDAALSVDITVHGYEI